MNKLKYIIACILLFLLIVLVYALDASSRQAHSKQTCYSIKITIKDSSVLQFVSKDDVLHILSTEYGTIKGVKLDSVKLHNIEQILNNKSSIKNCQAYITLDGKLNIKIEQREPIVKLNTPNGIFFLDETGYIFPAKNRYKAQIPVVEGDIPINKDYKGIPNNKKEKYWINNLIGMLKFMGLNKTWANGIRQIKVDTKGNLILKPRIGKEYFYFGPPDHYEAKFDRIMDYYRYIVPNKGVYAFVNVKYNGQIVCK